jgi:hypothetical protein
MTADRDNRVRIASVSDRPKKCSCGAMMKWAKTRSGAWMAVEADAQVEVVGNDLWIAAHPAF